MILSNLDFISLPLGLNKDNIFYLFNDFKINTGKTKAHTIYINKNAKVTKAYIKNPKNNLANLNPTPIKYPAKL